MMQKELKRKNLITTWFINLDQMISLTKWIGIQIPYF